MTKPEQSKSMHFTTSMRAFLSRQKGMVLPHALDDWTLPALLAFCGLFVTRAGRGALWRLRFGKADGLVLCDRAVRIYHPRYITTGPQLNLEEGCEIVGISKQGIRFGKRCTVGRFACIRPSNVLLDEPGEGMVMGDNSNIGPYSYIGCSGYIQIGSQVMMGPRVNLMAENHRFGDVGVPMKSQGVERSVIRIEDNCWIGVGSTILAGVTVHTGAVVAAGAVVSKDVPANTIVGGVPAKAIRRRD